MMAFDLSRIQLGCFFLPDIYPKQSGFFFAHLKYHFGGGWNPHCLIFAGHGMWGKNLPETYTKVVLRFVLWYRTPPQQKHNVTSSTWFTRDHPNIIMHKYAHICVYSYYILYMKYWKSYITFKILYIDIYYIYILESICSSRFHSICVCFFFTKNGNFPINQSEVQWQTCWCDWMRWFFRPPLVVTVDVGYISINLSYTLPETNSKRTWKWTPGSLEIPNLETHQF